jgi:lipopolysaccharide assembly protein A
MAQLMTNLIISAIAAAWIVAIALLSVQNATLVNLKFLVWQSIELPWGLILAGAIGIGFLLGSWLSLLGNNFNTTKRR